MRDPILLKSGGKVMYDYVDARYPVGGEGCRMSVCERRCVIMVLQRLRRLERKVRDRQRASHVDAHGRLR
jgi:hypothetical protein